MPTERTGDSVKLDPLATGDHNYDEIGGSDIIVPADQQPGDCPNFIQWKGTNLCADFWCPCEGNGIDGEDGHFHVCDMFAHFVRCRCCGQVYQLRTSVVALKFDGVPHIEPLTDIDA